MAPILESIIADDMTDLDSTHLVFKAESVKSNSLAAALLLIDGTGRYNATVEELLEFRQICSDENKTIEFYQYIVVPLRRYQNQDRNGIYEHCLKSLDPDYEPRKEEVKLTFRNPRFRVGNTIEPYFERLAVSGEVIIGAMDHIGASRGRDAANALKKSIRNFIQSGLVNNPDNIPINLTHDAGDTIIRCYFQDPRTQEIFQKIYSLYKGD